MTGVPSFLHSWTQASACPGCFADAAIVNYYSKGDTLGGHKDDVEEDLTQPLVSISIGCAAVFLMGGE